MTNEQMIAEALTKIATQFERLNDLIQAKWEAPDDREDFFHLYRAMRKDHGEVK